MRHGLDWTGAVVLAGLCSAHATAQEPTKAEVAKLAKAATAFVEVNGTFKQGSAFCVQDSGFFLTNQHVVGASSQVKLVLNPGLKDNKVVQARVVRTDKNLDLALLKVDDKMTFSALPLGSSDGLTELTEVIAVGFPFGTALSAEKGKYPAVSVNLGRITSLRFKSGTLDRIQMDAAVNPGNSGGPLLDTKGKVVGVVVSGVRGANVNFAIPASHVHKFVAAPEVEVTAPHVAYGDRYKPAEFKVRTVPLVPSKDSYDVELRLGAKGKERVYEMKPANGIYRVAPEPLRAPLGLRVTFTFADGRIEGFVKDQSFLMGSEKLKLSDVRTLCLAPTPSAVLTNANTVTGALAGLDDVAVHLGATTVNVNAGKAVELTVAAPANETRVDYTVIVRRDKQELARVSDFLLFKDAPGEGGIDVVSEARKLEGLWVLEKAEENGGFYPVRSEEALLIEGKQILWVKKNGKSAPDLPKAQFTIDPTKKPMCMDLKVNNATWLAIYKIEGNRLTIGTNANDEKRPGEFTTRLVAGPERSTFLRTYKRQAKDD
jgi:uncharacterized protein (TIGR03067 family)